jgi:hypothetical protein
MGSKQAIKPRDRSKLVPRLKLVLVLVLMEGATLVGIDPLGLRYQLKAQEVLFMHSATQPSPGTFIGRTQTRYYMADDTNQQLMLPFSIAGGIAPRHSLSLSSAGNFSDLASGMSDIDISWKWRFKTVDTSPINTSRTALISSLQVPVMGSDWSTKSFNPSIAVAHTKIIDRFGLGASAEYKINTGQGAKYNPTGMNGVGNALNLSGSVTYRLFPEKYTATTKGAWYLSTEGAWVFSNGDSSIRIGPSLFYEATTWVWEIGFQGYPINTGQMTKYQGMLSSGLRILF